MRRNRYRLRKSKYYSIVFANTCAVIMMSCLVLFLGYARTKTDISDMALSVILGITLCGGGYLSGYLYCRAKRHKGLCNGAKCGVIQFLLLTIVGIIYLGEIPPLGFLKFLPLLCTAGAVGGAVGVNTVIKNPPFTSD